MRTVWHKYCVRLIYDSVWARTGAISCYRIFDGINCGNNSIHSGKVRHNRESPDKGFRGTNGVRFHFSNLHFNLMSRQLVGILIKEDLSKFFDELAIENNSTKSRIIESILELFRNEYINYSISQYDNNEIN